MADIPGDIIAELQHAVDEIGPAPVAEAAPSAAPEPTSEQLLQELDRLADGHGERMRVILADYDAKRSVLERAIAARMAQEGVVSTEAEIARIKAEAGM